MFWLGLIIGFLCGGIIIGYMMLVSFYAWVQKHAPDKMPPYRWNPDKYANWKPK